MPDTLNDAAFDDLVNVGRDVLRVFPTKPGACVMMSALYAGGLRARGHTSVELVGGALAVGGEIIFGRSWEAATFTTTDLDWDGHAWIRYGEFIADVSILRTGFSSKAPPRLASHLASRFKPTQGLYIATPVAALDDGLRYEPQHVFSDAQVDSLYRCALTFLPQV
jgi:hypothetical protein